jgi:adenylate cyclase class IV
MVKIAKKDYKAIATILNYGIRDYYMGIDTESDTPQEIEIIKQNIKIAQELVKQLGYEPTV